MRTLWLPTGGYVFCLLLPAKQNRSDTKEGGKRVKGQCHSISKPSRDSVRELVGIKEQYLFSSIFAVGEHRQHN